MQEVGKALITQLPTDPSIHVTPAWIASTSSTHCLVSNGRRHSILESAGRLKSRSTHVINIAIGLLNILNIMGDASIILVLVINILSRVIFEVKFRLIALYVVIPLKRVSFWHVLCIRVLLLLKV